MISHPTALSIMIAAALALAACGGSSDDASTQVDASIDTSVSDTTPDSPATSVAAEVPAETTAIESADDGGEGCDQALSAAEIDAIFGTSVEISGSGQVCSLHFADDSIGSFQAITGSKGDAAFDELLAKYETEASTNGIVLDDNRGYILRETAIVRGASGQVFSFVAPDNVDVANMGVAMQAIADLLLTR